MERRHAILLDSMRKRGQLDGAGAPAGSAPQPPCVLFTSVAPEPSEGGRSIRSPVQSAPSINRHPTDNSRLQPSNFISFETAPIEELDLCHGGDGEPTAVAEDSTEKVLVAQSVERAVNAIATGRSTGFMSVGTVSSIEVRQGLSTIVASTYFELGFMILLILNAVVLALQRQYEGFDNANAIDYRGRAESAVATWPWAEVLFEVSDWFFGIVFCAEVVLKLLAMHVEYFKEAFNVLEFSTVVIWVVRRFTMLGVPVNPLLMRLIRLMRLMRLVKVLRFLEFFDTLHLMIRSIIASMTVLFWSLVLIALMIGIVAMAASQMLDTFVQDPANSIEDRTAVYESWGSFSRAVETVFEITFANWGPPTRELMNLVDEWWLLFFLTYKTTIGLSVIQVILAVFIQQVFKTANRDEEIMIKEKKASARAYMTSVQRLFERLDESGDGVITLEEFEAAMGDPRVVAWVESLDVSVDEVAALFQMLDDGDGQIDLEEFLTGLKAVRGSAKGTDILQVMREVKRGNKMLQSMGEQLAVRLPRSGSRRFASAALMD